MPLSQIVSASIEDGAVAPVDLSSLSQYTGFKNRLINGSAWIAQRGTSFTNSTGNIYTLDRWLSTTVSSNCTVQQITGSTGNNKAIQVTGAAGNATTQLSQKIEAANIYDCASQSVTVSFTISGSGSGSVGVRFLYPTATDNFTTQTEPVAGTTVNFTTTPTRYSVTRVLDSNANKGLNLIFERGATGAGVTWTLEDVQLEKGVTATSFDYRPYGTELALCQRYCLQWNGVNIPYATGQANSATACYAIIPYVMRTTPTAAFLNVNVNDALVANPLSSVTGLSMGGSGGGFGPNSSGLTSGRCVILYGTGASSYLRFDAEL